MKTGVLSFDGNGQIWEDLFFYLKTRKDKLEALEAYRQAIERKYGLGAYLRKAPWTYERKMRDEMFDDKS